MTQTSPLRLSQLTGAIEETLSRTFKTQNFWVVADITNHTFRADRNYHSFDLVEKDPVSNAMLARIQSKAWGKATVSITNFERFTGQRFTNNIHVLVNVSVEYHPVFGLQLNVNQIDSNFTLGLLEQQRRATLERLVKENPESIKKIGDEYITRNKELSLNRVIKNIAVISSLTSAGWQDFRHTLDNNPYQYTFVIDDYFTIVQGENNAQQLVDRLIEIFHTGKQYDAVVIIRGGGAQTDFLLFDDYLIGKAIAKFPIPIITGIGHQKNETIADLMAHTATKTPTKAAELIIGHNRTFEDNINRLQKTIVIRAQQLLFQQKEKLNHARTVITVQSKHYLENQDSYLNHFISMIRIASPENTLKRGFAIIKHNDRITSDPDELNVGNEIDIIFADKAITSTITAKKDYNGEEFNL